MSPQRSPPPLLGSSRVFLLFPPPLPCSPLALLGDIALSCDGHCQLSAIHLRRQLGSLGSTGDPCARRWWRSVSSNSLPLSFSGKEGGSPRSPNKNGQRWFLFLFSNWNFSSGRGVSDGLGVVSGGGGGESGGRNLGLYWSRESWWGTWTIWCGVFQGKSPWNFVPSLWIFPCPGPGHSTGRKNSILSECLLCSTSWKDFPTECPKVKGLQCERKLNMLSIFFPGNSMILSILACRSTIPCRLLVFLRCVSREEWHLVRQSSRLHLVARRGHNFLGNGDACYSWIRH